MKCWILRIVHKVPIRSENFMVLKYMAGFEKISALKLSDLESFRDLRFTILENILRAIKFSNLAF